MKRTFIKFAWSCCTLITIILLITTYADTPTKAKYNMIVDGLNGFAFNLYNQVKKPDQNIIISPYSLSSLFAILMNGADGDTLSQLTHLFILQDDTDIQTLNFELNKLNTALTAKAGDSTEISIANALWGDKKFVYKKEFLNSLQDNMAIDFFTLDFANKSDDATQLINQWVEKNTDGYIKNLISPGAITAQTLLVLTNAIYFKGFWQLPFNVENTKQLPFMLENGSDEQTPIMQQQGRFSYFENPMLQMLILPYAKSTLAMAILLPKAGHHVADVIAALGPAQFDQLVKSCNENQVNISVPKFAIESTFDSLAGAMQAMGLKDAFTDKANFSRMTDGRISISAVIQKAMIKVDEKGTVAAAASGIVMVGAVQYEPLLTFNANHPFIFIIFDEKSGMILFMGQVMDPVKQAS